jgi:ATP-dependent DNA helicase RecQ
MEDGGRKIEDRMERARKVLKEVFGFDSFRSLQEQVIGHVLAKKDALVIMPTGGGKSLCYQLPALIFDGLTIVISPLISLMKDQVEQLKELDIPAVLLNSSLSYDEYNYNKGKLYRGEAKLLYLAPEALMKDHMQRMLADLPVEVDCITVDEAHCISEWGHDFRPEYRQIMEVRQRFPKAVCLGLTATATPRVREDIKRNLNIDSSSQFIDSFDRPNLFLRILPKQKPKDQVLKLLEKFKDQSGIIYCFSRRQVDELAAFLHEKGFSVRPYHAGLNEDVRKENQELFIRDEVQIIVATVAFGMGINKSNIRFVVHFDLPKNVESYYQEIGRAGRDGVRAYCLLLFGYQDIQKIKFFIDQKEEQEQRIANIHLSALLGLAETEQCRRIPLLGYFGETYRNEKCGMCDNCKRDETELTDITIPAQKFLSCIRKTNQIFGAGHIIDVLRGSRSQKVIKFNHDRLSTYDIGKDLSKKQWFHLSRQFVQKGLLMQDLEYGSLKIGSKGYEVLRGAETVMGMLQEEKEPARKATAKQTIDPSIEYDQEMFERLRAARMEQARLYQIPPYMIFSDKTLIHMAALLPQTGDDLLDIHGVGQAKMKKYGKIFLDVIKNKKLQSNEENGHTEYEAVPEAPVMKPQNVSPRAVGEAFNNGLGAEEIMERFQLDRDALVELLLKYVRKRNPLRPNGILALSTLDPGQQAEVIQTFTRLGGKHISPVYDAFGGQLEENELKILQLYYLSCNT